jgi:hypothetical protein
MRFLGAWLLLGAVAIAGLVAGCGGNALNSTPSGGTAQSPMSNRVHNPKGLLVAPGKPGQLVLQGAHIAARPIAPDKKKAKGCIYLGMNISATTYMYNSATLAQIGTIDAGTSGWGIGDSKKYAFVGTNNGTDDLLVHKQCDTSGKVVKTYTGSNTGGNPYGVWAGSDNSAMSTNWPTNSIDQWGPNGAPFATATETNMGEAYFIWYDNLEKKEKERILVNGWNTAFSHAQADTCTRTPAGTPGPLTCTTMIANSGGFPGGIIAHHDASGPYQGGNVQNVVVNDQYGILTGYACDIDNATCAATGSFNYATTLTKALDFTAITFGSKCKDIWGANIFYTSSYSNIQGDAQQVTPDTVGGSSALGLNTPPIVGDEPLGIAISKPCKDS